MDDHKPVDLHFNRLTTGLDPRDRGFAKSLVYGVLRHRQYLDWTIQRFSKHPLAKMKPRTLVTLEVGVLQILLLDRIPGSAAVNATVDTLKRAKQPRWLLGFVNGVLRTISRQAQQLEQEEEARDQGRPILNHPQWLIARWQQQFGLQQATAICRVNNRPPLLTLRVNSRRSDRTELLQSFLEQGLEARSCPHSPLGISLANYSGQITDLPGFTQGSFVVQDESAQLASLLLGPLDRGPRILDGCAGLGGKTSHLAQAMGREGMVVAVEPEARRFQLLGENLDRLGLAARTTLIQATLEEFALGQPQPFEAILLDAPCSGSGVIRRQPDIRWSRQPGDLARYQQTQLALLTTCAGLLGAKGRLVYATCSLEPEENQEVIALFLKEQPDFRLEDARTYLPVSAHALVDEQGFFRPAPAPDHDGFFAAALCRGSAL